MKSSIVGLLMGNTNEESTIPGSCEGIVVCPAVTSDTHVVIGGGILIDCNKGCNRVGASPLGGDALTGCNKAALCKPMGSR